MSRGKESHTRRHPGKRSEAYRDKQLLHAETVERFFEFRALPNNTGKIELPPQAIVKKPQPLTENNKFFRPLTYAEFIVIHQAFYWYLLFRVLDNQDTIFNYQKVQSPKFKAPFYLTVSLKRDVSRVHYNMKLYPNGEIKIMDIPETIRLELSKLFVESMRADMLLRPSLYIDRFSILESNI